MYLFHTQALKGGVWKLLVCCALFALLALACTPLDYGVVLWSYDEPILQNGQQVQMSRTVDSDGTLTVISGDDERHTVQAWKLARFSSLDESERFAAVYTPYRNIFAQCEKKALPIREEANRFSPILYRLDENETVKVIGRGEEIANEGGLEDYWYDTLTSDGTRGWVFGYHLSIIDTEQDIVITSREIRNNIASFLNTIWRPEYFLEMQAENSFDLERFDAKFGLFPAPLVNVIQISLPDYFFRISYETPVPEGSNSFYFGANNELKITLEGQDTVFAEVNDGSEIQRFRFHVFPDDIQQIANAARAEQRAADR